MIVTLRGGPHDGVQVKTDQMIVTVGTIFFGVTRTHHYMVHERGEAAYLTSRTVGCDRLVEPKENR